MDGCLTVSSSTCQNNREAFRDIGYSRASVGRVFEKNIEEKENKRNERTIAGRFSRGYSGAWCRVRARLNANFPTVSILHPTDPQGRNSIFQR